MTGEETKTGARMMILHLTEDALGVSHFSDIGVPLDPGAFAPPAPPMPVSGVEPATGLLYLILPAQAGAGRSTRHRAGRWPSASLDACGSRRATASPASSGPAQSGGGGVAGAGHRTTVIGDEDVRLAIVQLPPQPGDVTKEDDP
jgi:hypothetical protein